MELSQLLGQQVNCSMHRQWLYTGSFLSWRPFFLEFSETFRLCPSLNKCILLFFYLYFNNNIIITVQTLY